MLQKKKKVKPGWVFDGRSIVNADFIKNSGLNIWILGDGNSIDEIGNF